MKKRQKKKNQKKIRIPFSNRTHQVHKSVNDYDRKDKSWKKGNEDV